MLSDGPEIVIVDLSATRSAALTSSPSSPTAFCLWLVEHSADCVHSPTGL